MLAESEFSKLFDEATLRKLEQLALLTNQVRRGILQGERRTNKRGDSVEFHDYRGYAPGDDLRNLDWNVLARLDKPYVKLREKEEDLSAQIIIDASASMAWPPDGALMKFTQGLRLAAAIGVIALSGGDQLRVDIMRAQQDAHWGPFRGSRQSLALFRFLDHATTSGIVNLENGLRSLSARPQRSGITFLISDLLWQGDLVPALNAFQARGQELVIIHLLSPDEISPHLHGDLNLIDIENGDRQELTLDAHVLEQYTIRIKRWLAENATKYGRRGIHYLTLSSDLPWDEFIFKTLRTRSIVK